jgi:sporulation protein YlmC with PRC-barrel domain
VIDQANGRIALVILSDVPYLGAKHVAIPYTSLVRTGESTFVLSFGDRTPYVGMGFGTGSELEGRYLTELTSPPAISDLYGIPSVMDANWVSEIYRHYGQVRYWKEQGEKPLGPMELYKSSKLMGAQAQTPKGMNVAQIHDFVIDSSNGRIALLVLSDVTGRPDTQVAVPFGALSRRDQNVFVLNATEASWHPLPALTRIKICTVSNLRKMFTNTSASNLAGQKERHGKS